MRQTCGKRFTTIWETPGALQRDSPKTNPWDQPQIAWFDRSTFHQGGWLAPHGLALAGAWTLHALHLRRLVRRPCLHEASSTIWHQAAHDHLQPLPNPSQSVAVPQGELLLADWTVQLDLPACGLFKEQRWDVSSRYDLVVLLLKVDWHHWQLVLCAAKEMGTPLQSSCLPSWNHAPHFLGGHQVGDWNQHTSSSNLNGKIRKGYRNKSVILILVYSYQ